MVDSDDARVKLLRAGTQREGVRLPQASVDASGLMVSRPNSFQPSVDIVRDKVGFFLLLLLWWWCCCCCCYCCGGAAAVVVMLLLLL